MVQANRITSNREYEQFAPSPWKSRELYRRRFGGITDRHFLGLGFDVSWCMITPEMRTAYVMKQETLLVTRPFPPAQRLSVWKCIIIRTV